MLHKMAALKFFCKITQKSSFNIQCCLRRSLRSETISGNWKPLRNYKKHFLICTCYEFSLNQSSDIREVWKHWPLKDGFRSISQKFYRTTILWWVEQKTTNLFDRHFFRERLSKYCIVELTDVFVCLLSSWSRQYSMKRSSNFDGP